MSAYVEITHRNGSTERHPLAGERVILGRQPSSDGIRTPQALELEHEHLLLVPRAEGCWLSVAQGARTPAVVEGHRLDSGMVAWGTEVSLGSLWLKLVDAPAVKRSTVGAPTMVLALVLVGAAGWLFLSAGEDELPGMTSLEPPGLFAAPAACPEPEPAAAEARAREAADAAVARSQRYPFAAQDGIGAVELYGLAASCFATAGRDRDAEQMSGQRARLVGRIEEDYRTHRLRLERAIQYRRTRQALIQTRELLDLVRHTDHPYTSWLQNLERHLALATESKS
jgi:hypothetical protein